VTTATEYFESLRFQKSATSTSTSTAPTDILIEIAAKKAERSARSRRGTHLIKAGSVRQEDRDAWVRENPRDAQRLSVRQIDERIVKASRDSDHALNAEIDRLEMQVAQWPKELAQMRKAERQARYLKTDYSIEHQQIHKGIVKKREAELEANPTRVGMTEAERHKCERLARQENLEWSRAYDPPPDFEPDGLVPSDDLFPFRNLGRP
jgi:hypothetical protein